MFKKDLIKKVSETSCLTIADSERIVNNIIKILKDTLKNEETIALAHFGKFEVVEKPERIGRNPKTGEPLKIAAKKVVKFKPSSEIL